MPTHHIQLSAQPLRRSTYLKQTGVEQAEHRIGNVIRDLEREATDAVDRCKPRLARKAELKRAGAAMALSAVHELLRNYEGRE